MDNLDEFMRKKFSERDEAKPFEFREAYWKAAQDLIRADREKRRRRVFWWWFSCFGALVIFGFLFIQTEQGSTYFSQFSKEKSSSNQLNPKENLESKSETALLQNQEQKEKEHTDQAIQTDTNIEKAELSAKASVTSTKGVSVEKSNKISSETPKTAITQPTSEIFISENTSSLRQEVSKERIIEETPSTVVSILNPETTDITLSNLKISEAEINEESAVTDQSAQKSVSEESEEISIQLSISASELALNSRSLSVDFLPSYLLYVPEIMQIGAIELTTPDLRKLKKPHIEKRFNWGIHTQGAAYQAATVTGNDLFSGGVGIYGTYIGQRKWGLRSALSFQHIVGENLIFDGPKEATITNYSFGFTEESHQTAPTAMQSIEGELALARDFRMGILHAGLFAGTVLSMQADYTQNSDNSLDEAISGTTKRVNIEPLAVPSVYYGFSLGYDYRLTKHLEIGLGIRFSPKGFFKADMDEVRTVNTEIIGGIGRIGYRF